MVKSGRVSYRNVIRCVLFWSDPSLCSLLWYHCDSALISSMSVFLTEVFVFVQIKPLGLKPSSLREADEFRKQRLMLEISGFPPDESESQMCPSVSENVFFFNTLWSSVVFYKVWIMPRSFWEEMCWHLQGYFFWFLKNALLFKIQGFLSQDIIFEDTFVCCIWCLASLLSWLKKRVWNILAGF